LGKESVIWKKKQEKVLETIKESSTKGEKANLGPDTRTVGEVLKGGGCPRKEFDPVNHRREGCIWKRKRDLEKRKYAKSKQPQQFENGSAKEKRKRRLTSEKKGLPGLSGRGGVSKRYVERDQGDPKEIGRTKEGRNQSKRGPRKKSSAVREMGLWKGRTL